LSFDPIAADGLCFALRSGLETPAALFGGAAAKGRYRSAIAAIFRDHLANREHSYDAERRVRPTAFWLRSRV
jgi:hypothetical protein